MTEAVRERTGATRAHKRRLYTMVKDQFLREIVPEGITQHCDNMKQGSKLAR